VSGLGFGQRVGLIAVLSLFFGVVRVLVAAPGALIHRQLPSLGEAPTASAPATKRQPLTLS